LNTAQAKLVILSQKQNANKRARSMAQEGEHLPGMHKALGSTPSGGKKGRKEERKKGRRKEREREGGREGGREEPGCVG
jgi:hypothetical protein